MKIEKKISLKVLEHKDCYIKFKIKKQSKYLRGMDTIFKNDNIKIISCACPEVRVNYDIIRFFIQGYDKKRDGKIMETAYSNYEIIKNAISKFKPRY